MSVSWKREVPLRSHAEWRRRISTKNRRQGTSAPTLAAAWAGPTEVLGALASQPAFDGVVLERLVVEAETQFDEFGGPRNHDLVVHGRVPSGERVLVCVEAKAGEHLGETVEQYRKAAAAKREKGVPTNAPERLQALLDRYIPHYDRDEERVRLMRYQLLSALAGTETEATKAGVGHAVLLIHEFLTDERPEPKTDRQTVDLHRFCTTVFDCEPPTGADLPWCFEVLAPQALAFKLYLGWAVTDLRTATLEAEQPKPS